jgi:hypothetical protein
MQRSAFTEVIIVDAKAVLAVLFLNGVRAKKKKQKNLS